MRDPVQFGRDMASLVRRYVARELDSFARRLDALERRGAEKGEPGASVTVDDIRPLVEAEIARGLLDLERRASDLIQRTIDRIPPPQIGPPGPPGERGPAGPRGERGVDGLGFDDLGFEARDDGRTIVLRFERGDQIKEIEAKFDVVLYRGVYRDGETYDAGDAVTWGGSLWIALRRTASKPGDGSADWRLAVKKGRDGRDGGK